MSDKPEILLDKELIKAKQKADFLKEQYAFFATIQKGSITQGQIIDAMEKIVEPYISKIKTVKLDTLK